jgi:ABC-type branched-subunit amino acid transport system substrate-binding protein
MSERILLLCVAVTIALFTDARSASSTTYQNALRSYNAGHYDSTISIIKNYLRQHDTSPEAEQMVPLVVEALIRKNDPGTIHRLFTMYKQKYASSAYLPRMWYIEGIACAKEYRYMPALQAFSTSLNAGVSETLDSLILANTEKVCANSLTLEELTAISAQPDMPSSMKEIVQYYWLVKLSLTGQLVRTNAEVDNFLRDFPHSRYESQVRDLVKKKKDVSKDEIKLGLLLPLSGDDAEVGKKVDQGIELAMDQHNGREGAPRIKSIICDEQSNAVETALRTKELLQEHNVPVIIGPVLSNTAAVCAAMSMGKNVVMLSPTATDDGIARIGGNIFQMNATMAVLGRKIARYALENLNIKEFAIITPKTSYGIVISNAFREEVRTHNCEVVAEETFDEGSNDFTRQFSDLRNILLLRKLDKAAMDKGIDYKPVRIIQRSDSVKYADTALSVGALFLPAEAEDVVMLAPQVAFNRIKTQILGSSGWNNPKVLADGKQYVVNAVISSSFEPESDRKEWNDFKQLYRTRYNAEPDRIAALGYDATSLILKALEESGWSPDAARITKALSGVKEYRGLSGMISFDSTRTNTEAAVLKITSNGYVRVQ